MIRPSASLKDFLGAAITGGDPVIVVRTLSVAGSAPREPGSMMVVSEQGFAGTIGGGRMEHDAIAGARMMISDDLKQGQDSVILGPDTGQCCGGQVTLGFERLSGERLQGLLAEIKANSDQLPDVYIFGAGHVGFALAAALVPLPLRVHLVDSRPGALGKVPDNVHAHSTAMPEAQVRQAEPGSGFVILTHDHGEDFVITCEALKRGDTAYVGMIGSKTKKERFRREFLAQGGTEDLFSRLVSPIGGKRINDKRPAVIAALAAAEVAEAVLAFHASLKSSSDEEAA